MAETLERRPCFPWSRAIAAAAIVAFARAALIAAKDGWIESGQLRIGLASLARNVTSEIHWVLGAALLLAALAAWG